eukprot:CAMPEP_0194401282 /NCGR_PEP_ID=MMETSP0174-20130528/127719_1 /TAXON_ID=216777 /ORGANISM="Proboscia alata, Strain PI-D3" /LENGTH=723 /DNA_ID=CAMNT_0039197965 /DNA_START=209 /DNA_END=2380 /DNA_ORIENTATION=+
MSTTGETCAKSNEEIVVEANDNDEVIVDMSIPEGYELIQEGSAKMLVTKKVEKATKNKNKKKKSKKEESSTPKDESVKDANSKTKIKVQEVFYNPVQIQNRDLSILMIQLYVERRAKRHVEKYLLKQYKRELLADESKPQYTKHTDLPNDLDVSDMLKEFEKEHEIVNNDWSSFVTEEMKRYEEHQKKKEVEVKEMEGKAGTIDDKKAPAAAAQQKQRPFIPGIKILDALAASGLRSIRYLNEIPGINQIIVNDLDPAAVQLAHDNIRLNQVDVSRIQPQQGDAISVLYSNRQEMQFDKKLNNQARRKQFDVIDLDPYGSASPFLDAAAQAISNGGMLCITCTDMAVLSGAHPETCYGRYGSVPVPRARYLHESALRVLLYAIATSAHRYGKVIKPICSVGMAFYIRVFVEVYEDKRGVEDAMTKIGNVYQSTQCASFVTVPHGHRKFETSGTYQPTRLPSNNSAADVQLNGICNKQTEEAKNPVVANDKETSRNDTETNGTSAINDVDKISRLDSITNNSSYCTETGASFKVGGPLYLAPIHDLPSVHTAISRLSPTTVSPPQYPLHTRETLHGLLTSVSEELPDVPLYYLLPDLMHTVKSSSPPLNFVSNCLSSAGYRMSGQHKEPLAIKTDAPPSVVWDVVRHWIQKHPIHSKLDEGSAGFKILGNAIGVTNMDGSRGKGFVRTKGAKRFPENPEKNWGPKPRATGKRKTEEEEEATEMI